MDENIIFVATGCEIKYIKPAKVEDLLEVRIDKIILMMYLFYTCFQSIKIYATGSIQRGFIICHANTIMNKLRETHHL